MIWYNKFPVISHLFQWYLSVYLHKCIYIYIPTILASIFPLSSHRSFHSTKIFGSASARATSSSSALRKGSWKRLQKSQKIARSTALPGAAISWGCYSACWCQVWIDIPSKTMCWDYDEYKCIYIYILFIYCHQFWDRMGTNDVMQVSQIHDTTQTWISRTINDNVHEYQ